MDEDISSDIAEVLFHCAVFPPTVEPIIVLVVDVAGDPLVSDLVKSDDSVPSQTFGGMWAVGQRAGEPVVGFHVIELGAGESAKTRTWAISNPTAEILAAMDETPHLVALMPPEVAGIDEIRAGTVENEGWARRLLGSWLVGVEQRSENLARLRREIEAGEPPAGATINVSQPGPEDVAYMRRILRQRGELHPSMSDVSVAARMQQILAAAVPPPVRRGAGVVSGYKIIADCLSRGGSFAEPEDKLQRIDLADGGDSVHMQPAIVLSMRHLSPDPPPRNCSDEYLAAECGVPLEVITRVQAKIDEVAEDLGIPATPYPRWWESTPTVEP